MADDSKFVLRWEINNATARFATGWAQSEVFDKGGFSWWITAETPEYTWSQHLLTLACAASHNQPWKCYAVVDIHQILSNGEISGSWNQRKFRASDCCHKRKFGTNQPFVRDSPDNTVIFEVHINIISSEGITTMTSIIHFCSGKLAKDRTEFAAPNRRSDVILKIGDEKLHVNKELLAVHSPVFEAMFFGDFAEKGKQEVEIKDVVFEDFFDLLHIIYLGTMHITDETVLHILKLADQFQIERIVEEARIHLTQSSEINVIKKLLVADQYNFADLKDQCLLSFDDPSELHWELHEFREYAKFSADMKRAICDRLVQLNPQ
ncbi:hypothetical protein PRIPAC_83494 [Pristionchus pacificus]|uniref:BTB domain-containing protein n=1 Tax=Pristionchus pacificus TaxID=54126 RepID=A0A2A6BS84_PRIPA|nr:hypothetical protein PRIPAC_83494 [Pristionchus pacificus]|eukprot:PDM68760.1 BTB domain-containing protein [Pristionchus pacificus]